MDSSAKSFESAEIEQLVASSTSELAPQLNAARKQWPYHPLVLVTALTVLGIAIACGLQPLAIGALVFGGVAWPGIFVLDRKRRTTTLDYNLRDDQNQAFGELVRTFNGLANCARVWRIPLERDQQDWKRHAGAGHTVERQRISLCLGLPSLIKSNLEFPSFPLGMETIYFAPDASADCCKELSRSDTLPGLRTTRWRDALHRGRRRAPRYSGRGGNVAVC
jgi:hypothetical protein